MNEGVWDNKSVAGSPWAMRKSLGRSPMWTKIEGFPRGVSSLQGQTSILKFPFELRWRLISTSNVHRLCHFQVCILNTNCRMSWVAGSVNNARKPFLPSESHVLFGWASYMTELPLDNHPSGGGNLISCGDLSGPQNSTSRKSIRYAGYAGYMAM